MANTLHIPIAQSAHSLEFTDTNTPLLDEEEEAVFNRLQVSHIAKISIFVVNFSTNYLVYVEKCSIFALFKNNLRIVHEQFTKRQN